MPALKYNFFLLFFCCCLVMGCTQSRLKVHTDYVSHENLASYYVDTPDPFLNCPPVGQRLIISWKVPKDDLLLDDLQVQATIRFRNREEVTVKIPICKSRGYYIYSLLNDDYFAKCGILTYKVELIGGGMILEEWQHQIWHELIRVGEK